ncbi:hypothetical protein J3F83DRAFT_702628 [Trichoderma novae-zelandiae]
MRWQSCSSCMTEYAADPPWPTGARNRAPNCCRHVGTQVWQRQMRAQDDVVKGEGDEAVPIQISTMRFASPNAMQSAEQGSLEGAAAKACRLPHLIRMAGQRIGHGHQDTPRGGGSGWLGGGCWPCPVRENDVWPRLADDVWEGGTGREKRVRQSGRSNSSLLELLLAQLSSTCDERVDFGRECRRELTGKGRLGRTYSALAVLRRRGKRDRTTAWL